MNRHGMTMIEIAPGTFTMGDDQDQNDKPHQATLTRGFFVCDREVWRDLFQQFLDDPDYPAAEKPQNWQWPDYAQQASPTGDCPATMVSWFDAVLFCNWLSQKEGRQPCYKRTAEKQKVKFGNQDVEWDVWSCDFATSGYRLPTEAEWEYACRAETRSAFCFGSDESLLPQYGFFYGNSKNRTWPGGSLMPSGWGLFDMHGNLWEWCWDWHSELKGDEQDPVGPPAGSFRVIRGGGWDDFPSYCRSSFRLYLPGLRVRSYGFRVVCGAGVVPVDSLRSPQ